MELALLEGKLQALDNLVSGSFLGYFWFQLWCFPSKLLLLVLINPIKLLTSFYKDSYNLIF